MGLGDPPNEPLAAALGTLEIANPQYDGPTPLFAGAFATASAAAYASANADRSSAGPHAPGSPAWQAAVAQAERLQLAILCDIFGPRPFRLVTINPAWLAWQSGTVAKLAQGIYRERAFDRLPILAEALEEAGCDNADILAHCRRVGPHVRGCWVVDLLLGKD